VTGPDLPPLGELVTDDPWWRYPSACLAGDGIAHLRVWAAGGGHLAVVSETGIGASVTNSITGIWAVLAARYPGPLTLIEHYPAAESFGGGEHLDLVHVDDRRQPAWRRLWPTSPANPDHDLLNAWMSRHGRVIIPDSPG
jgi:hypothetical protein